MVWTTIIKMMIASVKIMTMMMILTISQTFVVEMPPGAKPKTKHIFVAPLISFMGACRTTKGQQTPVEIFGTGAPHCRKSEQSHHVRTKNLRQTVTAADLSQSLRCSELSRVTLG